MYVCMYVRTCEQVDVTQTGEDMFVVVSVCVTWLSSFDSVVGLHL